MEDSLADSCKHHHGNPHDTGNNQLHGSVKFGGARIVSKLTSYPPYPRTHDMNAPQNKSERIITDALALLYLFSHE